MIREKLARNEAAIQNGFRMRGLGEVSRIEALSDGVIGFAITLLVVSMEVPRTFDDLLVTMRGFVAFAITFAMIFHVWFVQYKFFRRYGLSDNFTIWVTALLLFVVLFYVFPLKFVWTVVVNMVMGVSNTVATRDGQLVPAVARGQMNTMMVIFGAGFTAVFAIFALLYGHAYRRREALGLNELEIYDTRTMIQDNALNAGVGLLSVAIAALGGPRYGLFAGFAYWMIGPVQWAHGAWMGRRRPKPQTSFEAPEGVTPV